MSVRDSGTSVAPAYRPFLVSVQYVLALPRPGFDRTVVGAGDGPALHRRPAGNFARGKDKRMSRRSWGGQRRLWLCLAALLLSLLPAGVAAECDARVYGTGGGGGSPPPPPPPGPP